MRRHWLLLGVLCASVLHAQSPARPRTHVVTGLVFDSVVGAPLPGAVVQIVSPDSVHRAYSGVADWRGQYRIPDVPNGRFVVGFQHMSLDALGIESPLIAIELGPLPLADVALAIPSGAAIRAQRCPKISRGSTDGMLAGIVADPRTGPAAGAVVVVQWLELVRVGGKFATTTRALTSTVGADGTYLACGAPGDTWVNVHVAVAGHHVIDGSAAVPMGGAARQDFALVDSSVVGGTASIAGRVSTLERAPIASGRVTIGTLAVDVPIRDGTFSITGLPAGTWSIEARALGYEPHSLLVQLADGAVDSTFITITQKPQALETMSIIGKPGRDLKVLDAMVARSRVADGTMFMPGNEWLKAADVTADVLGAAKGFRVRDATHVYVRGCGDTVATTGDHLPGSKGKTLAVYLDGARVPNGLPGLNDMVPMSQVLAIESYAEVTSAPALWRTNDACAVVAVWTKR